MATPDKIKAFLSKATDISLGYCEINFVDPENIQEEQTGFSIDSNGNSLVTGNYGDWQEEWLVIATDQMGDPIMVDVNSPTLTVLSAAHGEGGWAPFVIADSFENFKNIIAILNNMSKDRADPVQLEENPITEEETQTALTKISSANTLTEIWYWEDFFENI